MSKHIFTVEVHCDSGDDYTQAVINLSNVGEITDEESDFKG